MARPNSGDPQNPAPLSPYQTPPGGMTPPPAGPYGPPNAFAPTSASAAAKSGPTPIGLLNALKRRWVLASLLGLMAGTAAAAAVWFAMPAGKHSAKAQIQIRSASPVASHHSGDDFESFRRTQFFLLKTRDLINRTLAEPSVASLPTVKESDDPARWLEDSIKVENSAAPDIITVSITGDRHEDLRTILDVLVKKYVDDSTAFERKGRDKRLRELELLAERFRAEINSKEQAIRRMASNNGTVGAADTNARLIGMQSELSKREAEAYETQRSVEELEVSIALDEKKMEAIKKDPTRLDLDPVLFGEIVDSTTRVREVKAALEAAERRLEVDLPAATSTDAPTIVTLKGQIEKLKRDLDAARKAAEPLVRADFQRTGELQLRNKIADAKEKLVGLRALLSFRNQYRESLAKTVANFATSGFDQSSLLKELEPQKNYLNKIEDQRVQLLVEKESGSRVEIREPAIASVNQNLKQKTMLSTAAGVCTLLGVLVVVGFLEWQTRRVDGVDQVVTDLGMRVIGTVPAFPNKASLKAAEAAGNANWRFVLNESINSTRTMLLHSARTQSMQVVMVTSATQGEGKTSLASQLGSSMATAGMRTLIVDCDLRNPSIHKLFDLGLTAGVSEVLCQEADVADAVQPTTVPNLWVIPAGQCSNRVIAALAQGHPLETLFNRLRGQFDFVIVDSCPVLPVADALLIGQHVDGVLFSIMQDISQLPKVVVASEKLQQLNIPLLGAVVNGVNMGSAYYAYGYNYVKQLPA